MVSFCSERGTRVADGRVREEITRTSLLSRL